MIPLSISDSSVKQWKQDGRNEFGGGGISSSPGGGIVFNNGSGSVGYGGGIGLPKWLLWALCAAGAALVWFIYRRK